MKKAIKNLSMAIILIAMALNSCTSNKKDQGNANSETVRPAETVETALPIVPVDTQRVMQIAAMLPEKPGGFGKDYHIRGFWDSLGNVTDYQKVVQEAEKLLSTKFPAWD